MVDVHGVPRQEKTSRQSKNYMGSMNIMMTLKHSIYKHIGKQTGMVFHHCTLPYHPSFEITHFHIHTLLIALLQFQENQKVPELDLNYPPEPLISTCFFGPNSQIILFSQNQASSSVEAWPEPF